MADRLVLNLLDVDRLPWQLRHAPAGRYVLLADVARVVVELRRKCPHEVAIGMLDEQLEAARNRVLG